MQMFDGQFINVVLVILAITPKADFTTMPLPEPPQHVLKQKVWQHTKPYICIAKTEKKDADVPRTTAKDKPMHQRENLTLNDWLTLVEYFDTYQPMLQEELVSYFKNHREGALSFLQPSLSHHLSKKGQEADHVKAGANPTALSRKQIQAVANPTVEKALWLWTKHMEKGEQVTGPMLVEKRKRFEEKMGVPVKEQLMSDGWVANFCKM
jgi:hypothetical protein